MIWLRTVLILSIIIFFQRIVIDKKTIDIGRMISFLLTTLIALAILFLEIDIFELYFPFFIVMVLIGAKALETLNHAKNKDDN